MSVDNLATADFQIIVWVVIAIIWGIVQVLANKKKRDQKATDRSSEANSSITQDDLSAFLESLSTARQAPKPVRPTPPPIPRRQRQPHPHRRC